MHDHIIRLVAICDEADRLGAARRGRLPRRKLAPLDFDWRGSEVWKETMALVETIKVTEGDVTYISHSSREDWEIALQLAGQMAQGFA